MRRKYCKSLIKKYCLMNKPIILSISHLTSSTFFTCLFTLHAYQVPSNKQGLLTHADTFNIDTLCLSGCNFLKYVLSNFRRETARRQSHGSTMHDKGDASQKLKLPLSISLSTNKQQTLLPSTLHQPSRVHYNNIGIFIRSFEIIAKTHG